MQIKLIPQLELARIATQSLEFKQSVYDAVINMDEAPGETGIANVSLGAESVETAKFYVKIGEEQEYALMLEFTRGDSNVRVHSLSALKGSLYGDGTFKSETFKDPKALVEPTLTGTNFKVFTDSSIHTKGTAGVWGTISTANSGKSLLGTVLASNFQEVNPNAQIGVISAGEPESSDAGSLADILIQLAYWRVTGSKFAVIDSMRFAINSMGGQLKTQGISRRLAGHMTQMNRIAAYAGMTVYCVFNPSSSKPEVIQEIGEDMYSSLAVDIKLTNAIVNEKSDRIDFRIDLDYSIRAGDRSREVTHINFWSAKGDVDLAKLSFGSMGLDTAARTLHQL